MRLWLFRFTSPDRPVISARVAANDRLTACLLLGNRLDRFLTANEGQHPEPGTILTVLGSVDVAEPQIISMEPLA